MPEFAPVFNYAELRNFMEAVPGAVAAEATDECFGDRDQDD